MNRDHGNDSGDQEREDQRWRDEEADHFLGARRGRNDVEEWEKD